MTYGKYMLHDVLIWEEVKYIITRCNRLTATTSVPHVLHTRCVMEGSLHLTATIPVPGLLHMKGEEITLYLGDDVFHDCSNIGLRCVTHQEVGEVYLFLPNCNKTCSTRVTHEVGGDHPLSRG